MGQLLRCEKKFDDRRVRINVSKKEKITEILDEERNIYTEMKEAVIAAGFPGKVNLLLFETFANVIHYNIEKRLRAVGWNGE